MIELPKLYAKCPRCGKLQPFNINSYDLEGNFENLGWRKESYGWLCPMCDSYDLNLFEAVEKMKEGKIVIALSSRYQYRMRDGKVENRPPLAALWIEAEDVNPNDRWRVME